MLLNLKVNQLKRLIQNPNAYLKEQFGKLRNQVDLAFFNKKRTLTNEVNLNQAKDDWNELISKISLFELECCLNKTEISQSILDETNSKLKLIEDKLNLVNSRNESDDEMDYLDEHELLSQIDGELIKLENYLYRNKTILFIDKTKFDLNPMNKINDQDILRSLFENTDVTLGQLIIVSNHNLGTNASEILIK